MSRRRRVFADISPLRRFDQLRYLVIGEPVSMIGRELTVAAPIQVYELTGSTLAVDLHGLVQFPALLTGSIAGGAVADAFARRRVLLVAQLSLAGTTAGLALNAYQTAPARWLVYLLASLSAFLSGIDYPARSSSIPRRAERAADDLRLRILVFQTAGAVGPGGRGHHRGVRARRGILGRHLRVWRLAVDDRCHTPVTAS